MTRVRAAMIGLAGKGAVGKPLWRATQHHVALVEARECWLKWTVFGLVWKERG
jgi:hypothetical protein